MSAPSDPLAIATAMVAAARSCGDDDQLFATYLAFARGAIDDAEQRLSGLKISAGSLERELARRAATAEPGRTTGKEREA